MVCEKASAQYQPAIPSIHTSPLDLDLMCQTLFDQNAHFVVIGDRQDRGVIDAVEILTDVVNANCGSGKVDLVTKHYFTPAYTFTPQDYTPILDEYKKKIGLHLSILTKDFKKMKELKVYPTLVLVREVIQRFIHRHISKEL